MKFFERLSGFSDGFAVGMYQFFDCPDLAKHKEAAENIKRVREGLWMKLLKYPRRCQRGRDKN